MSEKMKSLILDLSQAKPWPENLDVFKGSFNGLEVHNAYEDGPAPIPYEANVYITASNQVMIDGNLDAGGYGSCTVKLPQRDVTGKDDTYYQIQITPDEDAHDDWIKLRDELTKYGVRFRNEEGKVVWPLPAPHTKEASTFTPKLLDGFIQRFEAIHGDSLKNWSGYEELVRQNKHHCTNALADCLDDTIRAEIRAMFDDLKPFQATYLRDLAQLLVDLRQARV